MSISRGSDHLAVLTHTHGRGPNLAPWKFSTPDLSNSNSNNFIAIVIGPDNVVLMHLPNPKGDATALDESLGTVLGFFNGNTFVPLPRNVTPVRDPLSGEWIESKINRDYFPKNKDGAQK